MVRTAAASRRRMPRGLPITRSRNLRPRKKFDLFFVASATPEHPKLAQCRTRAYPYRPAGPARRQRSRRLRPATVTHDRPGAPGQLEDLVADARVDPGRRGQGRRTFIASRAQPRARPTTLPRARPRATSGRLRRPPADARLGRRAGAHVETSAPRRMEQSAGTCLSAAAGMHETEQPAGRLLKPLLRPVAARKRCSLPLGPYRQISGQRAVSRGWDTALRWSNRRGLGASAARAGG